MLKNKAFLSPTHAQKAREIERGGGVPVHKAVTFVLLDLGLLLNPPPLSAAEKSATLNHEVAARKWTGLKLRNLPKGASLLLELTTDGGVVTVLLLNEKSYARLPAVERPLFKAQTGDRIDFSIIVPETGNYYAVIDNRAGTASRKFTIDVKAAAETQARRRPSIVDNELAKLSDTLGKAFVFDALTIRAAKCGRPNAFSGAEGVIICAEFTRKLLDTLGDKTRRPSR